MSRLRRRKPPGRYVFHEVWRNVRGDVAQATVYHDVGNHQVYNSFTTVRDQMLLIIDQMEEQMEEAVHVPET